MMFSLCWRRAASQNLSRKNRLISTAGDATTLLDVLRISKLSNYINDLLPMVVQLLSLVPVHHCRTSLTHCQAPVPVMSWQLADLTSAFRRMPLWARESFF